MRINKNKLIQNRTLQGKSLAEMLTLTAAAKSKCCRNSVLDLVKEHLVHISLLDAMLPQ